MRLRRKKGTQRRVVVCLNHLGVVQGIITPLDVDVSIRKGGPRTPWYVAPGYEFIAVDAQPHPSHGPQQWTDQGRW